MSLEPQNLEDFLTIELHLMARAYFWADFSIIHDLVNKDSLPSNAFASKNLKEIKKFVPKWNLQFNEEDRVRYEQIFDKLKESYASRLQIEPVPLPQPFLEEFADQAIEKGKFAGAFSALQAARSVEKKVNQFITQGVQLLRSGEASDHSTAQRERIEQAAQNFFKAVKIKNPLGPLFQYLGPQLHLTNVELWRKYEKYVEQMLLKEMVEFGIHYLIDDKSISNRIIENLSTGKVRKTLLRSLAELFARGKANHKKFIQQYQEAEKHLSWAKEEHEFLETQKILLGRDLGQSSFHQYLKELAVTYPVSVLVIKVELTPGKVPFVAPLITKSESLVSFLELDR